ncbi:hypothetical protein B0T20DRAFT_487014 [Sordaria brevicollis]|uniref:Zn(2)-C6 fungal-type domain-containing protein n=1 Tax=Sordaria brevicollis TaxID=83679 RepID=A0AAE0P9N3_SORBR|nr:hypothetical protein B0T20DRAFT_487014 [Sordaria brevicollis]
MSIASTSPASSPPQESAKNPRVCLNCRRKKKRCDKALPSCSRCIDSLQVCQYDDESGLSGGLCSPGPSFHLPQSMIISEPRWGTVSPGLFMALDTVEDIHSFTSRCLSEVLGSRDNIEHVVARYFSTTNTWFAIVDRVEFEALLKNIWVAPSAETSVLLLGMSLITRLPQNHNLNGMADSVYLSVKTMLSVVKTKVCLSIPLMQAELLIAMYEASHGINQQAYMSVGSCCQLSRALGWWDKTFWAGQRRAGMPMNLQQCSALWWAIVYVDCLVQAGYQDHAYPLHTSAVPQDLTVPFPESFRQSGSDVAFGSWDVTMGDVGGAMWPEAHSAYYLSSVLQRLADPASLSNADRDHLSNLIMNHTISMLGSDRAAVVGTNFIALMRLSQHGILPSTGLVDTRSVDTIRSVIESIYTSAQNIEQCGPNYSANLVAPCAPVAAYYAANMLISHGETWLQDNDWLRKVECLKRYTAILGQRWKIADSHTSLTNIALRRRLDGYTG